MSNVMVFSVSVANSAQTAGIKPERLVTEAVKRWGELSRKQENCLHTYCGKHHGFRQHARGHGSTENCKLCFVLEVEMPSGQATGCEKCLMNRTS